ncbi:MAG: alpha/beta fold hydrolase [Alphaproteobacteria bacterium]|nr:alpha/beta fold hydrolase [Alphaproteobacteria bacterium]
MLDFVEVDALRLGMAGPRLSFERMGDNGPPVLLLHGIGANSMGFRAVMQGLAARCIAWNAPGYFLSDPFIAEAPTPVHYADAALTLLDALGITEPAHVVGSSFGSMIGACFAARHPARVATLSLFGASRGQRWRTSAQRAEMLAMRATSIAEGGVALARTRSAKLVAPNTPEPVLAAVRRMVAATDERGLMRAARCTDQVDVVADFAPHITAPTLVVTGTQDAVNPPEVGMAIADAITGARLELPAGIGHLMELEDPKGALILLQRHLNIPP